MFMFSEKGFYADPVNINGKEFPMTVRSQNVKGSLKCERIYFLSVTVVAGMTLRT